MMESHVITMELVIFIRLITIVRVVFIVVVIVTVPLMVLVALVVALSESSVSGIPINRLSTAKLIVTRYPRHDGCNCLSKIKTV